MEALFGKGFWDHVTLGVSFWAFDQNSMNQRNHSGKTESWWTEEKNKQLQARFGLEKDLEAVFIDSWSQQPWNLEDQLQQVAFQRETKKLWDRFSGMDGFEFKTIQDVIEELNECNHLLEGSIEQLQKDMEDRVEEIRQNGIEVAKVRHLVVLNDNRISLNLDQINENLDKIDNNQHNITENKDKIDNNESNIQANKDAIFENQGKIGKIEATVESVKLELEATIAQAYADAKSLIDSVKVDLDNTQSTLDTVKQDVESNTGHIQSNTNSINVRILIPNNSSKSIVIKSALVLEPR